MTTSLKRDKVSLFIGPERTDAGTGTLQIDSENLAFHHDSTKITIPILSISIHAIPELDKGEKPGVLCILDFSDIGGSVSHNGEPLSELLFKPEAVSDDEEEIDAVNLLYNVLTGAINASTPLLDDEGNEEEEEKAANWFFEKLQLQ